MSGIYSPGLTGIQQGSDYNSLVDFDLCCEMDASTFPDVGTESAKSGTGLRYAAFDFIINVDCSGQGAA